MAIPTPRPRPREIGRPSPAGEVGGTAVRITLPEVVSRAFSSLILPLSSEIRPSRLVCALVLVATLDGSFCFSIDLRSASDCFTSGSSWVL